MREENGRIRLTWQQIIWGVSVLLALVGGWYDLRFQIKQAMAIVLQHDARLAVLEESNRQSGFSRNDAEILRDEISNDLNTKILKEVRQNREAIERLTDKRGK